MADLYRNRMGFGMSDELNVSALAAQICGCADRPQHIRDCALIRDYGDKRYQQAIADVVEWLRSRAADDIASSTNCRRGNAGKTLIRFAQRRTDDANEITRRFGNDA